MDVNGTKFHLLLGRADWEKCKSAKGELLGEIWKTESQNVEKEAEDDKTSNQGFSWNEERSEITLRERLFKFPASPKDKKPDLNNRRGAARDRYGNWYWIDETGLKIKVLSVGSNKVSDFYPTGAGDCERKSKSDFQPVETTKQTSAVSLRGLAVTIDHFLVVGTLESKGLLIFDLFSTGEPRQILWREDIDFVPFDLAARRGGGVFVLDRENKRYWTLDREFNPVCGKVPDLKEEEKTGDFQRLDDFQPLNESEEKRKHYQNISPDDFFSALSPDKDPISIEALPDDSVLILNLDGENFSIIHRYYRDKKLDDLSTVPIKSKVKENKKTLPSPPAEFRLRGYDIAFVEGDEEQETLDRLYIVSEEGNQAFAFSLICEGELSFSPFPELPASVIRKNFKLETINEYFPMRLYGGKGFTAAGGKVYFDFGERWLPLIKQNRPDFVTVGTLDTSVFDGKETNCVWHRLMLDGCIPPETKIEVFSRNAERKEDLEDSTLDNWRKEPNLYLRGNGSELPFVENQTVKQKGKGTWELLLQQATGRFLQLRLAFSGNSQRTPRVSALRVYYPRFSYLNNYLPSIYREDEQPASFLDRFLANFEGIYTTIEDRIAATQMLFDVRSAPPDALDWLANWFGVALDPNWNEDKRRLFIRHAVEFFQYRGTMRGLQIALRLVLDSCADERIFEWQTPKEKIRDPIRIVERFQTRRTPEIIPADFVERQNLPRITEKTAKWKPSQGADVLHQRYTEKSEKDKPLEFPLIKPDDAKEAAIWEQFALEALGFAPSSEAATERSGWQNFLRGEYKNEIEDLNKARSANYKGFDEIFLPDGTQTNPALQADWREFTVQTAALSRNRKLWQDFLARRYRRIGRLNEIYGTNWNSFESISLFDRLPFFDKPLADWFLFESVVLAMHRTAHRFTVLIPAALGGKTETAEEQKRRLELVRRVVELEKPAHTMFDFRYYWNLFRVGEVRLGFDTLLGLGSRDPQLSPELTIGESFVGESYIAMPQPEKYSSRYVLGSKRLKQKEDEKP